MSKTVHAVYVWTMVLIVLLVTIYLAYTGYDYYHTELHERFYHPRHDWFKPSGVYGHGIGILGTLMILFGVGIYIARKRYNFMTRQLRLKYLLEFHIFLCTLGPILILFHTAFKFGGIVSVAFWSMVAVVLSGVIGRFIYIQIPHTIEGRAMTLQEVKERQNLLKVRLQGTSAWGTELQALFEERESDDNASFIQRYARERKAIKMVRRELEAASVGAGESKEIISMLKEEFALSHRIGRLENMQRLFKYWHVAHLPFALIMLIILIIHVAVTLSFGYRWIF
jgi:hypothetical protein